ncbi:MAG: thiamine diphosphokinase [Clostridia bacterium]|nr:thiamine diphosphokinase [Clostridia bacterium]
MRALIYTGGSIDPSRITEHPKGDDLCIAADSGLANAEALGVTPAIVLGDFDSIGKAKIPEKAEVLRVPAEKDFTDTQLAVDTALKRGADEIILIGGLSGRLDHTLSNLAILEDLHEKRAPAIITDGKNRARYLFSTSTLIPKSGYRYLSLICLSDKAKGVSVEGCKYPLKNATLTRTFQYAVSNELTGNCALVSVRKGGIYIIESTD